MTSANQSVHAKRSAAARGGVVAARQLLPMNRHVSAYLFSVVRPGPSGARQDACVRLGASSNCLFRAAHSDTASSLLKKPPGEGTGPTIYVDFRGNPVGRVPSHGERDVFQQAARDLRAKLIKSEIEITRSSCASDPQPGPRENVRRRAETVAGVAGACAGARA